MNTVKFNGWECRPVLQRYIDGTPRLDLVDAKTSEPIAVATVNVRECLLPEGWVHIKDYSENEGILVALEVAGLVKRTGVKTPVGFVEADICKLIADRFEGEADETA